LTLKGFPMATLEENVANAALTTAKLKSPIPDGRCWCFVHHVLAAANAKSFYEFNHQGEDPIFAAWGEPASEPAKGYIAVFKGVEWVTQKSETRGRGTVKTTHIVRTAHKLPKHVAVILLVRETGELGIAQQGVPNTDAAPSAIFVPVKHLTKGEVKYYRPVAEPPGKKTSSPTEAARAAAAPAD
jgi:hypothetical protein